MKVYVVTASAFDEYEVLGIFSKKEKAEKYIAEYIKKHGVDSISEYIENFNVDEEMLDV